jgi:peptide deformylase
MILTNDIDAIRLDCENVNLDDALSIVATLEQELANSAKIGNPGIGLAAPQCGIPKNVAIVRINDLYKVDLVNCKIKNAYDPFIFKEEGCLSFPGKLENTKRFNEIYVVDNLVYPYSFVATGLFAVVVQHELDHLNKILLPDIAIKQIKHKIRPNDKCPCGSKLKYKRCCFNKIANSA